MRIGLNLAYLLPGIVGGTETYAAGLLDGFAETGERCEFFVFVNRESREWPLPAKPNFHRIVCPISAVHRVRRYIFEQLYLPFLVRPYRLSLLHSLGYVAPLCLPIPSIVTIHDLNYQAFGAQMPARKRAALAFFVHQSASRSDRIITPSHFSKRQILDAYPNIRADRVVVIEDAARKRPPLQMSREEMKAELERFGIRQPYLMAFGNLGPNKNIPALIQAFRQAHEQHNVRQQLVIVGRLTPDDIAAYTAGLEAGSLILTGYLEDRTLQVLLHHAAAFIVASTYEGFGLPVLEAMAADVPVLCSNVASLPEVGGDAAVFFDPFSIDDMTAKIASVANSEALQMELRQRGREHVGRFSWRKTAMQTIEAYGEIIRP